MCRGGAFKPVSLVVLPLAYSGLFLYHFSVVIFYHQPLFYFALSSLTIVTVIADHSRPRHRSKCPVCTRLMRGGDNHPDKCHGCTIENKCDTCSKWTDIVWAGVVKWSQACLNRKRCATDKLVTKRKPALREEHSHKDKRARLETCNISSGSFLGFSPVPSPEIIQNRESANRDQFLTS